MIDGEAIVTNSNGLAVFNLLRRQNGDDVELCAFDLLELKRQRLAEGTIEDRKAALQRLLRHEPDGIIYNETFDGDGVVIYRHVCKLGCEGIVSKRLGSPYQSGRSQHWFKVKNPEAPAVGREAEIDWRRRS